MRHLTGEYKYMSSDAAKFVEAIAQSIHGTTEQPYLRTFVSRAAIERKDQADRKEAALTASYRTETELEISRAEVKLKRLEERLLAEPHSKSISSSIDRARVRIAGLRKMLASYIAKESAATAA